MNLGTNFEPAVSVTQSLPTEDQPSLEASREDRECHLWGKELWEKDKTASVINEERKKRERFHARPCVKEVLQWGNR